MSPRTHIVFALTLLGLAGTCQGGEQGFKDGFENAPGCASSPGAPSCLTVTIAVPATQIAPGEEADYCYYFRMPNAYAAGVSKFASTLDPVVFHASLHTTHGIGGQPVELHPPGTMQAGICGWGSGGNASAVRRLYWAREPSTSVTMPTDDGSGTPVAVGATAAQPAALEMHFLNSTDQPINGAVALTITLLPPWIDFTNTATYITYNSNISVPPNGTAPATDTCAVPASTKFWWFSTHTHSFAILAELKNGSSPIVVTPNWAAPAVATFAAPTFYQFAPTEKLTYSCTYQNNEGFAVNAGDSYHNNENCVAITYFFPATRSMICFNNTGPL
jgi:hypothetical protein